MISNIGNADSALRIIGGEWRSRQIHFRSDPDIRPTPVRIRETLFNWLQHMIRGASCLELYAGTGILSIEALSRGARHVSIVDQSVSAIEYINTNLQKLCDDKSRYSTARSEASHWLEQQPDTTWDVIFLDPPFESCDLGRLLPLISQQQLLNPAGFVYIETPSALTQSDLPSDWRIYRQKQASRVHYCLCHNA